MWLRTLGLSQHSTRARLPLSVLLLHDNQRAGSQVPLPISRRCRADRASQLGHRVSKFFITDDNFARNRNWEAIFDRLIQLRERRAFLSV